MIFKLKRRFENSDSAHEILYENKTIIIIWHYIGKAYCGICDRESISARHGISESLTHLFKHYLKDEIK